MVQMTAVVFLFWKYKKLNLTSDNRGIGVENIFLIGMSDMHLVGFELTSSPFNPSLMGKGSVI